MAAEDLRGEQSVVAGGGQPSATDGAVDLQRGTGFGRGQRWHPCQTPAGGGERGQVGAGQVRAHGLDPGAPDEQVDHVVVGPERHAHPGPDRAEPELLAGYPEVPEAGTTRSNSTGPHRYIPDAGGASASSRTGGSTAPGSTAGGCTIELVPADSMRAAGARAGACGCRLAPAHRDFHRTSLAGRPAPAPPPRAHSWKECAKSAPGGDSAYGHGRRPRCETATGSETRPPGGVPAR
jgi:hypothetical protein